MRVSVQAGKVSTAFARATAIPFAIAIRAVLCVLAGAAGLAPATALAQRIADAVPAEIEGQINGEKAHFFARGDDVLVAAPEADRLGLPYRDSTPISIGGTPLWIVLLASVTVDKQTRIGVKAGVVPSIAGYFTALRAHPAEALARSREVQVEINGHKVPAYDLGEAGVLLAPEVADVAGVKYREGQRHDLGAAQAWVVEMAVTLRAQESATTVIVAEPEPYFQALVAAAAGKARP